MTARAVLAAALAGCSGGSTPAAPDAQPIDATPPDAQACFGIYSYCFASAATGELVLRDSINTMSDPRCDPAMPAVCAIRAHDIVVSQALSVSGARPLALIGRTVQLDGEIALGKTAGVPGACPPPIVPPNPRLGGTGGSFGTRGGNGGGTGMPGPVANDPIMPTALRGGCPGGHDDASSGLTTGGIALIATQRITIFPASWINACGTGGLGPSALSTGGGGGGSGGMVLLDAPVIEVDGNVLAIGGGGGGGSDSLSPGNYGNTGCGQATITTATGGNGASVARGGDGATTGSGMPGVSGASAGEGGGGGGGGLILVHGTVTGSGTILPPKMPI